MGLDLYSILGPLLRRLDAERAHALALWALRRGLLPSAPPDDPSLSVALWGRTFPNPIGAAAGLDKNAVAVDPLLRLGFGFVEVGGVTPHPQPGNPRPRLFRLPQDQAVVNRMGFNNDGAVAVAARLARCDRSLPGLIGVNLGKNKDSTDAGADYENGAATFAPLADFLVINVSSPNTPGLRALQDYAPLLDIVRRTRTVLARFDVPPPLLVKISPDLSEKEEAALAELAAAERFDGLVVANTTLSRPQSLRGKARRESGGLSGRPLFQASTDLLRRLYRRTNGTVPLIGVGGVASGADAYAKIRAGASLVQLYTALVYHGPQLVRSIKSDLAALCRRDGFTTVSEAIGADHR